MDFLNTFLSLNYFQWNLINRPTKYVKGSENVLICINNVIVRMNKPACEAIWKFLKAVIVNMNDISIAVVMS